MTVKRTQPVVAIDGPAGAGKSTVTRRVAECLGYMVLDTGALYRCVALAAQQAGIDWGDGEGLGRLASAMATRGAVGFRKGRGGVEVWLDAADVSVAIRSQSVSEGASRVSSVASVRTALLSMQRRVGEEGGVVVEGRDIGTVVFPDAEAKFFLTASAEVRAERRTAELQQRGEPASYHRVYQEVVDRDERDMKRAVAPLCQAPDAIVVDSSSMTIDEVVAAMVGDVRRIESTLRHPS
jgi:CMP/dCMP kinase